MKNNYNYGSLAPFMDVAGIDWAEGRPAFMVPGRPLEIEIGFGTGEYLVSLAKAAPATDFVGFEQCAKRIFKTLRKVHDEGLKNIRIFRLDAEWGFLYILGSAAVDRVHCLFPCPWPKKKHAANRLFQPAFLKLVRSRLKDGGVLRIVTDHHPYVDWIMDQLAGTGFSAARARIGAVHGTKFEKKWQAGGQEQFSELLLVADGPLPDVNGEVLPVRTYFLQQCDLSRLTLEDLKGAVSVVFTEKIVDAAQGVAMVHAMVTDHDRRQQVWVRISHTDKGWCVCAAGGTVILPTDGARQAVDLVYEAALKTGK